MSDVLLQLRDRLAATRYAERARFARELDRLFALKHASGDAEKTVEQLQRSIERSAAQVERLQALPLRLEYDPALPIAAHREEIVELIRTRQLIVVCGATGSGKTTQLPKMCLEAGRGAYGLIGCTQPRRIAARAIADRLAVELATSVGGAVGYQVRFTDHTGPDCRVKLMTDGILLRELAQDRLLRRYDTIIIDEAHERSLNVDFLLGVLKRLLPQRPELRVIITSATIDPQRFATFFGEAPIVEVSGRSYPVDVRYRPLAVEDEDELSLEEGLIAAVHELDREDRGDVLVFLPGERQIRDAAEALLKAKLHHTEVLPLYSRLSSRDQQRIFEPHGARRIVLATNVAETSLTVPGVRHVIDSGLARISRYSVRGKVQRLPIEPISQASADQRKGRAGRERPGVCIRLYSEEDFNARAAFTPPEVLRTNLASVILQMAALNLGEPQDFPFVDPPDTRLINDGYRLLQELKAVDDNRNVTSLGRQISTLPIDPRLARMLLAATHHRCLAEMLVLTAFLAAQDPRERPNDAQAQAEEKHAQFHDPRSDFLTVLNLWNAYRERAGELSGNQLRRWLRENFLSPLRMREWQEMHRQLTEALSDLKLHPNETPAEYGDLHQAILTGFLGQIGALDERREYEGARGARFVIAPGTPLASKPPKWVVAASLVETTRLYARVVAAVEPHWIESAGAHLLKRSYSDPHWVEQRGFVAAFESTSLYGLTLAARRRVNYGAVAPNEAREIFVREALIERRTSFRAPFLEHNIRLRRDLEALEAKARRRDILIDEQTMCDWYRERLPGEVHSVAALDKFLRQSAVHGRRGASQTSNGQSGDESLRMRLTDLMRRDASEITEEAYPDVWLLEGNALPIRYRFEPGAPDDGATISVPLPLLSAATPASFSSPIPGWRSEKITEILRALPKAVRKAFVPVPEHAARAARELDPSREFNAAMAEWITRESTAVVTAEQVAAAPLPEHLKFNLRVIDLNGAVLAEGRDLAAIKRKIHQRDDAPRAVHAKPAVHRSWDFGELPIERQVERRGLRFTVYPTLRDHGDGVELTEASNLVEADGLLRRGVLRLSLLTLADQAKYARKRFADARELVLLAQGVNAARPMADALTERVFAECFLRDLEHAPRSATAFERLIDDGRGRFGEAVDRVLRHATETLQAFRAVRQTLAALSAPLFRPLVEDVQRQLAGLIPEDFPAATPDLLWPHLPRYLKALLRRLEKGKANHKRDAELSARTAPAIRAHAQIAAQTHRASVRTELDRLQWMIEELRVSLFAQDLRTAIAVSEKRVAEQIELARAEARLL